MSLGGRLLKEWPSIADACRELKIAPGSVYDCATGKQDTAKGFVWKFIANQP